MAVETDDRLRRFEQYQNIVNNHTRRLAIELEAMRKQWIALNVVYGGDAARQFSQYWEREFVTLQECLNRLQRINTLLYDQIDPIKTDSSLDLNSIE